MGIMKNRLWIVLVGMVACGVMVYFILPLAIDIYTSLQIYNKRVKSQADYTKITTPLSRNVVEDVCSKFEIGSSDARCLPGSVAYGPDFFSDIKTYFRELPRQEATFETVQDKLGAYLVVCEDSDNEGYYRCWYDLRGDAKYSIVIYFTKDGYIDDVIANTGGS